MFSTSNLLFVFHVVCTAASFIHDEVAGPHNEVNGLHDEVTDRHKVVVDTYSGLTSVHDEVVAFTAWTQRTQIYSQGDPIIFDGTIVNEGGHYEPSSGGFACPHDAVYYVSVTSKRAAGAGTNLQVLKGTDAFIHIDDGSFNDYNIISNSALIDCQQGQIISVRGYGSGAIYGSPGQAHSTFTVLLIWRDIILETNPSIPLLIHNSSFLGFSSYNLASYSYDAGEVVPFGGVILSSPDYDTDVGVFTGIYYVITHLQKIYASDLYMGVSKDATITLHSEDAYCDNEFNTVSNSRLLSCQAGENLAVTGMQEGSVYGSPTPFTTFTAMLVYEAENLLYSSFLGFTMMKNSDQTYVAGDRITFETPLQDDSNVYNMTLNAFVCPDFALYYMSVTFVKAGTAALNLAIVMETGTPFHCVESYTGNPGNTVSNGGLFHCIPGQQVFVVAVGNGSVHGHPNKALTTFTIMKIFD